MVGEGLKHAQDCCTAANVQDDLVLEDMSILVDCISVRPRANIIFLRKSMFSSAMVAGEVEVLLGFRKTHQHFLVYAWMLDQSIRLGG